jgi:hypothetical protein
LANQSAIRLSFVLCKSTGEPIGEMIRAALRRVERRRNIPTVATVALRLEDPQAVQVQPGLSRLKVYRTPSAGELALNPSASKQLVFYGSLPADGVAEDTDSGLMTLSFMDPRWVLKSRYLIAATSFTATDQATILRTIIATQNTRQALWFTTSGTTGTLRDRNYDAGKNVADLIDEMTKVQSGVDLDFTPLDGYTSSGTRNMGNVFFTSQQGIDRPGAVLFYLMQQGGSSGGGNINKVVSSYAPIFNSSTQQGTDPSGVANTQRYTAATGYDLLETYETASDAFTSAVLLEKAQGVVFENDSPRRIIEVGEATWHAPVPWVDYDLGDTLRLTVKRGSLQIISQVMKVDGYDAIADQEGNVRGNPILTSLP